MRSKRTTSLKLNFLQQFCEYENSWSILLNLELWGDKNYKVVRFWKHLYQQAFFIHILFSLRLQSSNIWSIIEKKHDKKIKTGSQCFIHWLKMVTWTNLLGKDLIWYSHLCSSFPTMLATRVSLCIDIRLIKSYLVAHVCPQPTFSLRTKRFCCFKIKKHANVI